MGGVAVFTGEETAGIGDGADTELERTGAGAGEGGRFTVVGTEGTGFGGGTKAAAESSSEEEEEDPELEGSAASGWVSSFSFS